MLSYEVRENGHLIHKNMTAAELTQFVYQHPFIGTMHQVDDDLWVNINMNYSVKAIWHNTAGYQALEIAAFENEKQMKAKEVMSLLCSYHLVPTVKLASYLTQLSKMSKHKLQGPLGRCPNINYQMKKYN